MACGDRIDADAIPARLLSGENETALLRVNGASLAERTRAYEREIIAKRLKQCGNTGRAKDAVAKELGISRATLYRRLAEFDIT
ncbi:MAG: helix-turn-helix domain-containing protein [Clostridiales Family XIII bacterium]|nr:helix-turn-helix domain-containing protein [Clostridiales Family XIII bacterium]